MNAPILAQIHVLTQTLHKKHFLSRPDYISKSHKSGLANWFEERIWTGLCDGFPDVQDVPLATAALLSLFGPTPNEASTPPPLALYRELLALFRKFARRFPARSSRAWLVEFALAYSGGWRRAAISRDRIWDERPWVLGLMAFQELVRQAAKDTFDVLDCLVDGECDRTELPGLSLQVVMQILDTRCLPKGSPKYAFHRLITAWQPELGGHLFGFTLGAVAGGQIRTSARNDRYIRAHEFRNGWLFAHESLAARLMIVDVALEQDAANPSGDWRRYNGDEPRTGGEIAGGAELAAAPIACIYRGQPRIVVMRDPHDPRAMLPRRYWRCANETLGRHYFDYHLEFCPRCKFGRSDRTTTLWVPARFASFDTAPDDPFPDATSCREIAQEQPANEPGAAKSDYGSHLHDGTSAVVFPRPWQPSIDDEVERIRVAFTRCRGHYYDDWLSCCPRCKKPGTGEWEALLVSTVVARKHASDPRFFIACMRARAA